MFCGTIIILKKFATISALLASYIVEGAKMTNIKTETKTHPPETALADFLSGALTKEERADIENHIGSCGECLTRAVSAYEAVKRFEKEKKGKIDIMKKINIYLMLAIASFILSFAVPQYFIQFLAATLLLGIKWIVDSKSTKMLVMIYEAWKRGGEKEASHILETLDSKSKNRF